MPHTQMFSQYFVFLFAARVYHLTRHLPYRCVVRQSLTPTLTCPCMLWQRDNRTKQNAYYEPRHYSLAEPTLLSWKKHSSCYRDHYAYYDNHCVKCYVCTLSGGDLCNLRAKLISVIIGLMLCNKANFAVRRHSPGLQYSFMLSKPGNLSCLTKLSVVSRQPDSNNKSADKSFKWETHETKPPTLTLISEKDKWMCNLLLDTQNYVYNMSVWHIKWRKC